MSVHMRYIYVSMILAETFLIFVSWRLLLITFVHDKL